MQLRAGVIRPHRHSLQSTSVRATQIPTPRPTSLTSAVILRVCTGSLAAARKGHSRARRFGTTFTFLVQFSSPAARSASSMQRFIWEGCSGCSSLGASARHACACIVRIESLAGTMLLGILAASGSFGAFSCMTGPLPRSAALSSSLPSPPCAVPSGCSCAVALRAAGALC